MIRIIYEKQLYKLRGMLEKMGMMVEQALLHMNEALQNWDLEVAQKVVQGDDAINEMELKIEDMCIRIITTQQPVAGDLREITSVFKMITDLERIADQAADICSCLLEMKENQPQEYKTLCKISTELVPMYRGMLKSYRNQDVDLAEETRKADKNINKLFWKAMNLFDELIEKGCGGDVRYILIAKYLEGMGDHITNICEWIIYRINASRTN